MAREAGISQASVQRLWAAQRDQAASVVRLSKDTQFEAKFWDVIGLYLDEPEKALVLCCDEKSQCEVLERTQPGSPLGSVTSGRGRTTNRAPAAWRHNAPQPKSPVNIALWLPFWIRASGLSVPDAGTDSRAFIPR
jgi:hypothetical protein